MQAVVADCRGCAERGLYVRLLKQAALLRGMCPNTSETIGLKLEPHGQRVLLLRIALLQLRNFLFDTQNFLHVMSKFVRHHVGLREFSRGAEALLQFVEKAQIDVDFFVFRTIKRTVADCALPQPDSV